MKITQAFTFEAAHRLPNVPATHRCLRMHGQSYRVEVRLEGPVEPQSGFAIDFFDVERVFAPLLDQLDHIWIWNRVKPLLPQSAAVVVYETANCLAEYNG